MNILITGGAGFIGNHLFNKLTAMGHSVHVIDKNKNPSITKNFHKIDISKKDQLMRFKKCSWRSTITTPNQRGKKRGDALMR